MKCYLGWSVVFVAVFGGEAAFKWCETNGKTGCVGQARCAKWGAWKGPIMEYHGFFTSVSLFHIFSKQYEIRT